MGKKHVASPPRVAAALLGELFEQAEVDAGDGEVEVIWIPDAQIHLKPLLKALASSGGDIRHQHFRWLALHHPGGATGRISRVKSAARAQGWFLPPILHTHPIVCDARKR